MINKFNIFLITLIIVILSCASYAQNQCFVDKKNASVTAGDNITKPHIVFYQGPQTQYIGTITYGPDYVIGPEVPIDGLTGFYDWQTNGACMHLIAYYNSSMMHAIYMTSSDSVNFSDTRRTKYSASTDGGTTWTFLTEIPSIRSGFGTLTVGNTGASDGVAIISNHYSSPLTSGVHVDLSPGAGAFTSTIWPMTPTNFIWPSVSTFTNGNVYVAAQTYQGAGTDTGTAVVFNPNSNQWVAGTFKTFVSTASSQTNMRWAGATGPGGKGIYVLDAIGDEGNSVGGNRIFYYTTADNGVTWSNENVLFESFVDGTGDTVTAWLGIDAVYDNAGNFYVVYNTIADSFQTAKIWVSKNGNAGVLVASNLQIPGSAKTLVTSQANMITMDWPSLSISDDGQYIFCAYDVTMQNDIINNFQACDVYYSFSQTGTLNFQTADPIAVTSTSTYDERFPSLNRTALTSGGDTYVLHLVYQKDPQPGSHAFSDNAPVARATLTYRKITQAQVIGINPVGSLIPDKFELHQNYPNPFNPTTKVRFDLPLSEFVTLKLYDVTGKLVKTLINEKVSAGVKEYELNASDLPSGVYFYSLTAGTFSATKKMVLVK